MATGNGQCTAPAHIVMVQYPHLYIYTCLTFSADCAPFNGLSDGASDVWFSGGDCGHHICEVEATRCCAQCQRLTKLLVRHAFGHLHTHLRNGKSQIGGRLPEWGCTCFCATTVCARQFTTRKCDPLRRDNAQASATTQPVPQHSTSVPPAMHLVAAFCEAQVDARRVKSLAEQACLFDRLCKRVAVHAHISGLHLAIGAAFAKERKGYEDAFERRCSSSNKS
jgi:hypothetical protein